VTPLYSPIVGGQFQTECTKEKGLDPKELEDEQNAHDDAAEETDSILRGTTKPFTEECMLWCVWPSGGLARVTLPKRISRAFVISNRSSGIGLEETFMIVGCRERLTGERRGRWARRPFRSDQSKPGVGGVRRGAGAGQASRADYIANGREDCRRSAEGFAPVTCVKFLLCFKTTRPAKPTFPFSRRGRYSWDF